MSPPRVVLASASPRRLSLLEAAGLELIVEPADVDEELPEGTDPVAGARLLAERKAWAVAARHRGEAVLVVGADTVVALDEPGGPRLLGKPTGPDDARAMLARLSGSRHRVVTGVSVVDPARGEGAAFTASETTYVTMRVLGPAEIEAYVASGEWEGKAGGYAIQESADAFVTRLEEGGFDNVVGLPVALTLDLLARARAAR